MTKPYVDIGFVIPLHEEFERVANAFPILRDRADGGRYSAELNLGVGDYSAVAFLQDAMGKAAATRTTNALLADYDVGLVVILGIAGGIDNDVAVGDVCFTGSVIDVLENAKITDKGKQAEIDFATDFYKSDRLSTFALKYVMLGSDIKPQFEDWQLTQSYEAQALIPGEFIGRRDRNERVGIPRIHDGSVVCGYVSKSNIYKSNLVKIDRKILAIETESGGAFRVCEDAGVDAVCIRGICDYADKNKNKLEQQTDGRTREIAANNAVSFFRLQLYNPQIQKFIAEKRQRNLGLASPAELHDPCQSMLTDMKAQVHQRLMELSPAYHGKPMGYRLPLPRIKPSRSSATASPSLRKMDPVDILEAVTTHRVTLINVSRTYPDSSLPWIVAGEFASIEINGKQVVPIVIDGGNIRLPKGSFPTTTGVDFETLNKSQTHRAVVIVTEFHSTSKARTTFLTEQMEMYPEARFVIINRMDASVKSRTDLVTAIGSEEFDLCEISFFEMAHFFQRSFDMQDQEASVVALRFQDMFKKFRLDAHPTYFAGIASEMLSALLKANRRAELLQLAMSGFLSFVVATDKSAVVLSRTTREVFLRKVVYSKKVEGRKFDEAELVKFTKEFASENDYEIEALDFIKSFQDRGIIHFDRDGVHISLPFIETYLLASELVKMESAAESYFDISSESFDFATFDVYSELGPSEAIVSRVIQAIKVTVNSLPTVSVDDHILLTNKINPALLSRRGRIEAFDKRIKQAVEDVVENRSNSAEKQLMIDVANRVQETARERKALLEVKKPEVHRRSMHINNADRVWGIATTVLGSGSERISAEKKRELCARIVELTSSILNEVYATAPTSELDKLKAEISDIENLKEVFEVDVEDDAEVEKLRQFVTAVIEAYEFSVLTYPIRMMFQQLGDSAGQPVLRLSVSSFKSVDKIQSLIARVWEGEIDAQRGKDGLITSIRNTPEVPFLRTALSSHFIARVFWDHWEKGNRLALLDAAEECMKPLNRSFDKGRIKRLLEKDKPALH